MRKQHFAEEVLLLFFRTIESRTHVPQCKPLHIPYPRFLRHKGDKRRENRRNRMPRRTRKGVPVPRRSRRRIGGTARRENHGSCIQPRTVLQLYAAHGMIFDDKFAYRRIRVDLHILIMQMAQNGIHHIGSTVTLRKDTIAALSLQRNAQPLKKSNYVRIVKRTQTAVEKSSISHNVFDDVRNLVGACDVAAPLARNHHLAAGLLHFLQKEHGSVCFRRLGRRHETCRSRADNEDAPRTHRSSARR